MTVRVPFNRFQAGLTHLSVSAGVALVALAMVYAVWYPSPMADAQGVSRLLLILIAVDVALGPLITTIIWSPAKGAWLRFDLLVVALVQTLALLYGLQAIYGGRPAYLVFNVDRFDVTAYQEVNAASHARAAPEFQRTFWGYRTVSSRLPEDQAEREDLMFSSAGGGADLPQLPHRFLPLEAERATMLAKLHPLRELKIANDLDDAQWAALIESFGKSEEQLGYLPMAANLKDGAVILDRRTGEILDIRLLTPSFAPPAKQEPPASPSPIPSPALTPGPTKTPAAFPALG